MKKYLIVAAQNLLNFNFSGAGGGKVVIKIQLGRHTKSMDSFSDFLTRKEPLEPLSPPWLCFSCSMLPFADGCRPELYSKFSHTTHQY